MRLLSIPMRSRGLSTIYDRRYTNVIKVSKGWDKLIVGGER